MSHLSEDAENLMTELKRQMSRATFGNDIVDLLVAQLECPICLSACSVPIYMCSNGHNICSRCQPQIEECPVCRIAGRPILRNLFAEEVSVNAWQNCKNVAQGCPQSLKIKVMKVHLEFCDYGYKCMFENCDFCGSVVDLEGHVKKNHGDFYFECSLSGVTVLNDYRDEVIEQVVMGSDEDDDDDGDDSDDSYDSDDKDYSHDDSDDESEDDNKNDDLRRFTTAMIAYKNKIFWYHAEHMSTTTLKVQIRHIGSTVGDKTFSYQLKFESADRTRTLVYRNRVRSLADGAYSDVVFSDSLPLSPYLDGSLLSFRLEIFVTREEDKEVLTFEDPGDGFPEVRSENLKNWESLGYKDLGDG